MSGGRTAERRRTPVDEARDALISARGVLAQWHQEQAAAATELEELRARAGELLLEDPKTSAELARRMQELQHLGENAGRAVQAAEPRVAAAERAYLLAEADALEAAELSAARRDLAAHRARTDELLAQLEKHEGRYVPEHLLIVSTGDGLKSWETPKSGALEQRLEVLEAPVLVLRALAEGHVPVQPLSAYPACVASPGALVKAPVYLRSLEEQQARLRSMEQHVESQERVVRNLTDELARAQADGRTRELGLPGHMEPPTVRGRLTGATKRLEELRGELERARGEIASSGVPDLGAKVN